MIVIVLDSSDDRDSNDGDYSDDDYDDDDSDGDDSDDDDDVDDDGHIIILSSLLLKDYNIVISSCVIIFIHSPVSS